MKSKECSSNWFRISKGIIKSNSKNTLRVLQESRGSERNYLNSIHICYTDTSDKNPFITYIWENLWTPVNWGSWYWYLHIFLPTNSSYKCLETQYEQRLGHWAPWHLVLTATMELAHHPTSTAAANCWVPTTGLPELLTSSFHFKQHTDPYEAS